MKTNSVASQGVQPREVDRFLTGLAASDTFGTAFPDVRSGFQRWFGSPRFAWQTGWMTVDRVQYVFVHLSAWPPGLLHEARTRLQDAFVVSRAESGLLDKRHHHPFMVVLISGRRT